jgi:catechol 2,3-dioxygenase-like lactoylglutathione lyase family enzyme
VITKYSHTPVWVLDQDSAKRFYTEKLGFEVRTDMAMDGLRWLTVGPKGQPDFELILANPGPPMVDDEAAKSIRALVARGALGAGVMETDDCRRTYQELTKKGVTFLQEPADRPSASRRCSATTRGTGSALPNGGAEIVRGRRYRIVLFPPPVTSPACRVINLA